MTVERHEIVLGVQADVTRARVELESLEKIAHRLRAALGGGGGPGMPVGGLGGSSTGAMPPMPPPGSPGGPPGMGNSSTVPSGVAVSTPGEASTTGYVPRPQAPRDAQGRFVSPSGVAPSGTTQYVPPGAPGGNIPVPGIITPAPSSGGGNSTVPSGDPPGSAPGGGGGGGGGGGRRRRGGGGDEQDDTWGKMLVRLPFQGAQGGSGGIASGIGGLAAYGIGGPVGVAAAALGALTAGSLGAMNDSNAKRARIESEWGHAGLSGMLGGWEHLVHPDTVGEGKANKVINQILAMGQSVGIASDQLTGGMREYNTRAGGTFGPGMSMGRSSNWIELMLAGVSPGTSGGVDSTMLTKGAEGDYKSATRLAAVGSRGFAMAGGLDGWMQQLTGQIDRLLDRGINVDLGGMSSLLEKMAADPSLRYLGSKAPAVAGAVGGVAADVRQTLMGPYQQLAHQAVMADALGQANGDPFEAMRVLEDPKRMGPQGVLRAIRDLLGTGDVGKAAIASVTTSLGLEDAGRMLVLPDKAMEYNHPRYTDGASRTRAELEARKDLDAATWKAGTVEEHAESVRSSRAWSGIGDTAAKTFTNIMDFINKVSGGGEALVKSFDDLKVRLDNFTPSDKPFPKPAAERGVE